MTSYKDTPQFKAAQEELDSVIAEGAKTGVMPEGWRAIADRAREQDRLWREDTDRQVMAALAGENSHDD